MESYPNDVKEVWARVIKFVDRSTCSFCARQDWGLPERDNVEQDIPNRLRWRHQRNRQLCDASTQLEEGFRQVFGTSD